LSTASLHTQDIRLAIYSESLILSSGLSKFLELFDDYEWMVGDTTYRFSVSLVDDTDIIRGHLTTDRYDVFVMPGGGGGGNAILTKSYLNLPFVKIWRKNMINYIKDGGGYFAVCGGTYFLLGLDRQPHTPYEYYLDRSSLNVSCVRLDFISYGNPIYCQWVGLPPEAVGHAAYLYYTGWNSSQPLYSGIPLDVPVNRSHAIFKDMVTDTVHIRWIGGPAYSLPEHPDRMVSVLAYYPSEEISDNTTIQIHAWKYMGGFIRGFLPGFFKYVTVNEGFPKGTTNVYAHAGDWKKTDVIIATNFSNKPFMTAEEYPNQHAARIVVCSGHPEFPVWWGGSIQDSEDVRHNSLYDSLYLWKDVLPENQTIEDEKTHTWWMVRRAIAWAAKIPDSDLPPIYGPSQVSNIAAYEQADHLFLIGNSELKTGRISLDLWYRFSDDNMSWSPWHVYGIDTTGSDGWGWDFTVTEADGLGFYQFYSIRQVLNGNEWTNETAPPGPDAITHFNGNK